MDAFSPLMSCDSNVKTLHIFNDFFHWQKDILAEIKVSYKTTSTYWTPKWAMLASVAKAHGSTTFASVKGITICLTMIAGEAYCASNNKASNQVQTEFDAIMLLRKFTNLGLGDSKELVDQFADVVARF